MHASLSTLSPRTCTNVLSLLLLMPILKNEEAFKEETRSSPGILEIDHNTRRYLATMLNSGVLEYLVVNNQVIEKYLNCNVLSFHYI